MAILNFQEHIDVATQKKGEDYFRKERVTEVAQSKGKWSAYVQGREEYPVYVTLEGKFIAHTYCERRAFNHIDHCKHVVALLYAILEQDYRPSWNETHPDPYVISLLNGKSSENLQLFLLSELQYPTTANAFLEFAETTIDNEAVIKNILPISSAYVHASNIEDYTDNDPGKLAVKPAHRLLVKAKQAFRGDITVALDKLFAIISKGKPLMTNLMKRRMDIII